VNARRRVGGENDVGGAFDYGIANRVIENDFAVEVVVVLADGKVEALRRPRQLHARLHLRVMHGLGSGDAIGLYVLERLETVCLELSEDPLPRSIRTIPYGRIEARTKVAASGLDPELASALSNRLNDDSGCSEQSNEAGFLEVSAIKEPKDTSVEDLRDGPTEPVPQIASARLADKGCTKMGTEPIALRAVGVFKF
jgi:hypothetical protein